MASQIKLAPSASGDSVQAFPLRKGLVNITTGTITDPSTELRPQLVHCVIEGNIVITWPDDSTSAITMVIGDDFSIVAAKAVSVSTGAFHFA